MRADKPVIVKVRIKRGEEGLFYGTSEDLPGLLIGERSSGDAMIRAKPAVKELYEAVGIDVKVGLLEFDIRDGFVLSLLVCPTKLIEEEDSNGKG